VETSSVGEGAVRSGAAWAPTRAEPLTEEAELAARAAAFGPRVLDDAQTLQVLCGVAEAQALDLLAVFGSLPEVWGAPFADLARRAGAEVAVRVKVAQEAARRALSQPLRARSVIASHEALFAYLRTALVGAPREQFRVLFLDKRNRLIAEEVMGEGTVDHAPVYPREVMRRALELNASAVIAAHNHPGGDPTPSTADIATTRELVEAGRALRIAVHDHVLVAGDETVSFKARGLM
jgi:DNA repair protein RadC